MFQTNNIYSLILTFILFLINFKYVFSVIYVVNNSEDLRKAINLVNPGDQIELRKPVDSDLYYPWIFGSFVVNRTGTANAPIVVYGNSKDVALLTTSDSAISMQQVDHWILKGFTIKSLNLGRSARGVQIFKGRFNIIEDLEIHSTDYGIQVVGSSDIIIRNCNITSSYQGIHILGYYDPIDSITTTRNHIVNNTFIYRYDQSSPPDGPFSAISVSNYDGHTCCGTIENNLFRTSWQYWVYMGGSNYLIRNNTGDTALDDGFYVYNERSTLGQNNTFQSNHCNNVIQGYCIKVDPVLMNSTCIWSDNTYNYALGLSNMEERCDKEEQTEYPTYPTTKTPTYPTTTQNQTYPTTTQNPTYPTITQNPTYPTTQNPTTPEDDFCTPESKTTTTTTTNIEISEKCPKMFEVTTITTTTSTTLESVHSD